MLFYFPVIYGAGFYADDVFRATTGYYGWDVLGRWLAKYTAITYSLGSGNIIDPMPFGYVLNISIIGLAAYSIYSKLSIEYNKNAFIIAFLFLINPFLIQNLLYRFDSIGMILSLFFAALSFSVRNCHIATTIKIIALLISLNLYQTFSNIYIGLVAVELLFFIEKYNNTSKFVRFIAFNLFVFIVANALYFVELKILSFNSGRGSMLPIDSELPLLLYKNIISSLTPFITFWSFNKIFIFAVIPFLVMGCVKVIAQKKYLLFAGIIVSSILIAVSGVGFMAILREQFVAPRGLTYIPTALMAATVIISFFSNSFRFVVLLPVFACFIFASRVGNMQSIQKEFEKPIFFMATKDMHDMEQLGIKKFFSIGTSPLSRYITNTISVTPFNGFMGRGGWVTTGLMHEYGNKNLYLEWSNNKGVADFEKIRKETVLSVDKSPFYKIYTRAENGWIVWGDY